MQRILSIFLICGILGQVSIRTAWTLHYQWNRAVYMAQCENKDKPSLHCDGKCAFKKHMAARENNKNNSAPQLPEHFSLIKDIQLFFEPYTFPLKDISDHYSTRLLPRYDFFCPDAPSAGIFRPPAA